METEIDIFLNSKNVFLDTTDAKDYIQIDRIATLYKSLYESIKKPLKMILLYGKPGTGKSMFLSKLHLDLTNNQPIFIYKTPILDENEFFRTLALDLFSTSDIAELNFTQFINQLNAQNFDSTPLILLDEAQLYSDSLMEKIRLLSDTRKLKFVITLHKTQKEDLIAKEHFQTRIWESIELKSATKGELKIYIQKKLMKAGCYETANLIDEKSIKLIHKLTDGNYRDTNKLMFTIFDIYIVYAKTDTLHKIDTSKISNKLIEMAAIHSGLIND